MTSVRTPSPAKINIGLEILGKRDDGYHEIRTIMQAISLADTVTIAPSPRNLITSKHRSIAPETNLALRAAKLWTETLDPKRRALSISLQKRIPVAAGLGGASSNAATVLALANALFDAGVSDEDLGNSAGNLGSDVPFFFGSTAALASGRGEILTPLPPLHDTVFVLVTPEVDIPRKTATMYGHLRFADFSDGARTRNVADRMREGKAIESLDLFNAFERPLLEILPDLEGIPTLMRSLGGQRVGLSGAGPTWYAVLDSLEEANALAASLRERVPSARVETAQALSHRPEIEFLDDRNGEQVSRV